MGDLDSTLDAIDEMAVHHCGHCDTPLGPEAPSKYWCDDECQEAWNEARSEALRGYREPTDLPQHVYNLHEDASPETTPWVDHRVWANSLVPNVGDAIVMSHGGQGWYRIVTNASERMPPAGASPGSGWTLISETPSEVTYELSADTTRFDTLIRATGLRLDAWQRRWLNQVVESRHAPDVSRALEESPGPLPDSIRIALHTSTSPFSPVEDDGSGYGRNAWREAWRERGVNIVYETGPVPFLTDEPADFSGRAYVSPQQRALEARRYRNTGPQRRQRAPRRIDARGNR